MSTLTVAGTQTFPSAPGGPNTAPVIGAPVITPDSTSGPTLTYEEGGAKTLSVAQTDGVVTVSFDTVADADYVYIGTDQPLEVVVAGGTFLLAAGGFMIIYKGSITAMTVEAKSSNDAEVFIILLGD